MVSFVNGLFQKFKNVKNLLLNDGNVLELILTALGANLKHLSLIAIGTGDHFDCVFSCSSLGRMTSKEFVDYFHCDGDLGIVFDFFFYNPNS